MSNVIRCAIILDILLTCFAPVFALASYPLGKDYNIMSYGAIGDGHKDDAAAIQKLSSPFVAPQLGTQNLVRRIIIEMNL